ncbi:hypothetical protein C4561_00235 [candidate division WWE3 bacterium]|uniref:Uncharacterized protein n=1 Tax=candidate division WWE3 bacterium TaxID=2053526 RepID=A0A3A4ZP27_UNCKA|nr:MAG: hypothetical protein C4561_00235 [candidate division WWE3 bacterium]
MGRKHTKERLYAKKVQDQVRISLMISANGYTTMIRQAVFIWSRSSTARFVCMLVGYIDHGTESTSLRNSTRTMILRATTSTAGKNGFATAILAGILLVKQLPDAPMGDIYLLR